MAAKHRLLVLVILFAAFFTSPSVVSASPGNFPSKGFSTQRLHGDITNSAWLADLVDFINSVKNGNPSQLVGVFVPGVLELPVVQQPPGDLYAVSQEPGVITQYGSASRYGNVGLLAHNNLAGAAFFNLQKGQEVTLVYGNGHSRDYTITAFRQFQATIPESPFSNFIDLDDPNSVAVRSSDIFNLIYAGGERVVFQTCIARDGDASWGRLFVIATPKDGIQGLLRLPLIQWIGIN